MTPPPAGADPGRTPRSPWEHALELHTAGKTSVEIAAALAEAQLDAESIAVLINALPNARMPQALPEAKLDLGVNPLAPGLFSIFELGLQGSPRLIGLYWLAFGGGLAGVVGIFMLLSLLADAESELWSDSFQFLIPRLGFGVALAAAARGAYLWLSAVHIRRK